jgi:putative membrane-bound dehydrogenase-like protein
MAGFDDRGRLYVADNAGQNLDFDQLQQQLPNLIRRLEDTNGDGRFDRSTVFADKLTFPQGAAWFRGAVYVASPPYIWRLEDTDDDGVADRRQQLVGTFGSNGNAADIHGCFVTPTGRIAWCDGRHGHEFKDRAGEITSQGLAARVFTCRPDGSDLETFCGGGMDNPVEVAFTPEGDTIGTMTFYNPDDERQDALVHFVWGGVYPRKHPCTSEFKRTGELMPALSKFGVTAPSGLARYDCEAFGPDYRDNLFSAQFNTHKIVRHQLAREKATFRCTDEDFLVSTHPDFHPTDVLVDADGSLLVVDTGGWFRIGCPTSQIAKPEIGGAIYRIRRRAATKVDDPRGATIDWAATSDTEAADLLADSRPAVVERAIELLVTRGDGAMGTLATALFDGELRLRQNAMWALARIGSENALLLLRQGLSDDDPRGRLAAVKGVGDLRDAGSILPLIAMLETDEPPVRREAATALGRLRRAEAVPAILKALEETADRFEEHALIFALIEIGDRSSTAVGLKATNPAVRRGALIALDQMAADSLTREQLTPLLGADDATLLATVIEILGKHPDWADAATPIIAEWIARPAPTETQLATLRGAASGLLARPAIRQLVGKALETGATPKVTRLALLEVIGSCEPESVASDFSSGVAANLGAADGDLVRQAIATASVVETDALVEPLVRIGLDERRPAELRVAALRVASKRRPVVPDAGFALLSAQLEQSGALRERLSAAEALGSFRLTDGQLRRVVPLLAGASSLETSWLLGAFAGNSDGEIGRALAATLAAAPALAALSSARVEETFRGYPADIQTLVADLIARTQAGNGELAARLDALASADGGDRGRGEQVFFSQRAACSACHQIGSRGERIGPNLSKIGEIRTRRDLAEAILAPSASLARGYESASIATTGGLVHHGLVARETASAVMLRTTDRVEVRVPRDQIETFVPSPTSIMPQGLDKTLSPEELRDLVAFLQSLK